MSFFLLFNIYAITRLDQELIMINPPSQTCKLLFFLIHKLFIVVVFGHCEIRYSFSELRPKRESLRYDLIS